MDYWLTAAVLAAAPANPASPPVVQVLSEVSLLSGDETCTGPHPLNLNRAVWLKNGRARVWTRSGPARVRIDGEHLLIDFPRAHSTYFNNMRYQVSPPGEDLDIELRLGRFGGRLGVYWRETFRHHPYRLGAYLVDADAGASPEERPVLTLLCSGGGGMRSED